MADVLTVITFIVTIANTALILWFFRHHKRTTTGLHKKLNDLNLDREITDVFSHDVDGQDVHKLAFTLFKRVKQLYKISAHSYSEMVGALERRPDIEAKLREALTDFFNNIIHVSYREKKLDGPERNTIKQKLRLIMNMLPDSSS